MLILCVSYGNDSIALIRWMKENGAVNAIVAHSFTGWATDWWPQRVAQGEQLARSYGFHPITITGPFGFESLCLDSSRQAFPRHGMQFCTIHLKGLPFLDWVETHDPEAKTTIAIGKRREESQERANTPEFIPRSEYHGGRTVWHPLYMHNETERNALIKRAGFDVLPHRSMECSPCVNANREDLKALSEKDIQKVERMETQLGQFMFRAEKKMNARGIRQVIKWANSPRGKFKPDLAPASTGCSAMGLCETG